MSPKGDSPLLMVFMESELEFDARPATTPKQVAEWMAAQIEEKDELLQQAAAYQIQEQFGEEFVCLDPYGELGIARKVLYQFRKLTAGTVVWVAVQGSWTSGFWRKRDRGDREGRRQWYY